MLVFQYQNANKDFFNFLMYTATFAIVLFTVNKLLSCYSVLLVLTWSNQNISVKNGKIYHIFLVPGIPSNVACGTSASKSLNVSWKEPLDPNGKVRLYKLTWMKLRNRNADESNTFGERQSYETPNTSKADIGDNRLGKFIKLNCKHLSKFDISRIMKIISLKNVFINIKNLSIFAPNSISAGSIS